MLVGPLVVAGAPSSGIRVVQTFEHDAHEKYRTTDRIRFGDFFAKGGNRRYWGRRKGEILKFFNLTGLGRESLAPRTAVWEGNEPKRFSSHAQEVCMGQFLKGIKAAMALAGDKGAQIDEQFVV